MRDGEEDGDGDGDEEAYLSAEKERKRESSGGSDEMSRFGGDFVVKGREERWGQRGLGGKLDKGGW